MKPRVGVDLVELKRFKKAVDRGQDRFLKRVFCPKELSDQRIEHLAGLFAAKEAIVKALSLPAGSWQKICVSRQKNGRPKVAIEGIKTPSFDLSISHDGNFAIAVFLCLE